MSSRLPFLGVLPGAVDLTATTAPTASGRAMTWKPQIVVTLPSGCRPGTCTGTISTSIV